MKQLPTGKQVLTGNQAAAYGLALADLDVFGGYPITPQTEIPEEMARLASEGIINTTYCNTDSELASMALGIGVATAEGRFGTATSSQGLALMCELLHWAVTSRLSMGLTVVSRSVGAPWSIHPDQTDSLLFRDFFMPQIYCINAQEIVDMTLWAYRMAEYRGISLPVMLCFDGFMLSHTAENVVMPEKDLVRVFLPPRILRGSRPHVTLPNPSKQTVININCPHEWRHHALQKQWLVSAMQCAHELIPVIADDWRRVFNSNVYGDGFLQISGEERASIAAISMGAIVGTMKEAFYEENERAVKVIGLRFFRPFPTTALRDALRGVSKIAVFDRSILPSGHGVIAEEMRLRQKNFPQPLFEFVGGFGGQNLSEGDFGSAIDMVRLLDDPRDHVHWLGDNGGMP